MAQKKKPKQCSGAVCLRGPKPGRVKMRGLRALERANRALVKGLGDLDWGPDPTVAAHFFVGLDKGKQGKNRTGWCSTQPNVFTAAMADDRFTAIRAIAMKAHNAARPETGEDEVRQKTPEELRELFGLSRVKQAGWFKDPKAEKSHRYSIFWNGSVPGEETIEKFASSMKALAENVSASLCQDQVIVAFESPTGDTSEGRSASPDEYAMAAGTFGGRRR